MKNPFILLYVVIGVLALTTVALAATTMVYYGKYAAAVKQSDANAEPATGSSQTVDQLIEEIGRLIDLPTGEKPTVATVADPSKLNSQPFFADAKIGDKVLIYPAAHKAILYRPSEHKLIEVGPFTANVTSTNP